MAACVSLGSTFAGICNAQLSRLGLAAPPLRDEVVLDPAEVVATGLARQRVAAAALGNASLAVRVRALGVAATKLLHVRQHIAPVKRQYH